MKTPLCSRPVSTPTSRREFLFGLGATLGSVALTDLRAAEATAKITPLTPKPPMHTAKAKACILLFMEGGAEPGRYVRPQTGAQPAAQEGIEEH